METEILRTTAAIRLHDSNSYRIPLSVSEVLVLPNKDSFPICPKCNITLEREYQAYCDRCGQCLDCNTFEQAEIILWSERIKNNLRQRSDVS